MKTNVHLLADLGFDPYTSILVCHEDLLKKRKELVKKVVKASQEGWLLYKKDPKLANKEIIKRHQNIGPILNESAKALDAFITKLDGKPFGWMQKKRWQQTRHQHKAASC